MVREILYLYILRIFGVDQSDEFDYKIVNRSFPISFKVYIKKITCYPQLVTREIYDQACKINVKSGGKWRELPLSVKDRLFINILAVESKKQAQLLFMARAISTYI